MQSESLEEQGHGCIEVGGKRRPVLRLHSGALRPMVDVPKAGNGGTCSGAVRRASSLLLFARLIICMPAA